MTARRGYHFRLRKVGSPMPWPRSLDRVHRYQRVHLDAADEQDIARPVAIGLLSAFAIECLQRARAGITPSDFGRSLLTPNGTEIIDRNQTGKIADDIEIRPLIPLNHKLSQARDRALDAFSI